jgi:hypothetical protein
MATLAAVKGGGGGGGDEEDEEDEEESEWAEDRCGNINRATGALLWGAGAAAPWAEGLWRAAALPVLARMVCDGSAHGGALALLAAGALQEATAHLASLGPDVLRLLG